MSVSKTTRFEVFKRDRFTCQYCGKRPPDVTLECDHVLARAEGGGDEMANLTTSCWDCNRGKGARNLGDRAPALDELEVLASVQEMLERKAALGAKVRAAQDLADAEGEVYLVALEWWREIIGDLELVKNEGSFEDFALKLSPDEPRGAMRATRAFLDRKPSGRSSTYRYFCGVCWNLIRGEQPAPVR